jgi:multiple antibiotic resistance protein
MFEHRLFNDFVILLVVIDPINVIPAFMLFTQYDSPEARKRTALRAVVIAAVILVAFIIAGQILLEALRIDLPSFSIAGGLVLLAVSLQRILRPAERPVKEEVDEAAESPQDVAVFPLATPIIAGPGSIITVVLLTDNEQFGIVEQMQTTLVMLGILVLLYLMLLVAERIQRFLGNTGADVLSRIAGLVLAAISVDIIIDGIRASFFA